ncbi:MAG: site-2 protease family protein, partial [Armatimonadota bacterium]|nr:site-2 protease family protein [Armatimonadota bacterium]
SPSPPTTPEAPRSALPTWPVVVLCAGIFIYRQPELAKTIGIFLLVLGVLVFVHEWGHYQFARWAGMKVNRFAVGFPPWIYSRRQNGIDYSIGALPIGGMVDIAGLGSEEEMIATAQGETVETATREARPDMPYGQRQFQDTSLMWRFWTLFAGPLMNIVFAIAVFVAVFSFVGVPDYKATRVTQSVREVSPDMPAAAAGVLVGDRLIGLNGQRIANVQELVKRISRGGGKPLTVMIERDGHILEKRIRPVWEQVPRPDGSTQATLMIGVGFQEEFPYVRVGFGEAMKRGWEATTDISMQIVAMLGRAVTGKLSEEEKQGIGGPVKIAQIAGATARDGWQEVALFAAALSVNLGLMNMLPIPALDGGRILFLGFELLTGRPVDTRKEGLVHMVGMMVLLAFMLFITVRDVLPWIERGLQRVF